MTNDRRSAWRHWGWFFLVLAGAGLAAQPPGPARKTALAGPSDSSGYVGSAACTPCHAGISRQFSRTAMGRSMSAITPELLQTMPLPATVESTGLNRHFEVYREDGKLVQSESQTDAAGKEVFRDTHALDWVVGANANGFGALLQRDGYLFQAPLSFYAKPAAWGLSPGYEFEDLGFNRPVLAGCISCHSGRARPIANTNGRFAAQPFAEAAIGCENCHGPGAAHIHAMQTASKPGTATAIVNPAKLTMPLANDICMSCHQTGSARVAREGKTYQDFRPGQPLASVLSILMVPPTAAAPPQDDHLEHVYSMTLSKCYRASEGRMGCITCHDPHVEPTRDEAPAFFNGRCLSCHTRQSCTLAPAERQRTLPADNCIGCHMQRRDVRTISHSTITNHRILARPDEGFPESAFHQTTAALPDLIQLNSNPGEAAPPPLTLLQAYGELSATRPEYVAPYLRVLAGLEQTDPERALVQAALGRKALRGGDLQSAADHLQRAIRLGQSQATVYGDLAEATTRLGKPDEGLALLRKATELDPFNPALQKTLVARLVAMKRYEEAVKAMKHYLSIFPQDGYLRKMLDLALGEPAQP